DKGYDPCSYAGKVIILTNKIIRKKKEFGINPNESEESKESKESKGPNLSNLDLDLKGKKLLVKEMKNSVLDENEVKCLTGIVFDIDQEELKSGDPSIKNSPVDYVKGFWHKVFLEKQDEEMGDNLGQ